MPHTCVKDIALIEIKSENAKPVWSGVFREIETDESNKIRI